MLTNSDIDVPGRAVYSVERRRSERRQREPTETGGRVCLLYAGLPCLELVKLLFGGLQMVL